MGRYFFALSALLCILGCNRPETIETQATPVETGGLPIDISNVSIRTPMIGQDKSEAYFTIANNTEKDIEIVSASSDIAKSIQFHIDSKDINGNANMQPINSIKIAPHSKFDLAPGGTHFMLFGIKNGVKNGDSGTITIKFADGKSMALSAQFYDEIGASVH